jgi:hypothetical protein
MLIEVSYKNGHKERRICGDHDTLVSIVEKCETDNQSKIQTIRVIKRNEHSHRGHNAG